jgi:DNA replication protein DnaC
MTKSALEPRSETPQVLLAHHLRKLRLPTFLREYDKVARESAKDGHDHPRYLLRLAELELIDRERRIVERRMRAAKFPAVKSIDTYDFLALPTLNKPMVLELARCEFVVARENVIALGNSGTGKTHIALALGLAACQRGFSVAFVTAASLASQLMEARDERRLLRLQQTLAGVQLLIVDGGEDQKSTRGVDFPTNGYVPLSQIGAELLFDVFSQRYERAATLVTSNLPFEEWTSIFGSERLTGALLDRITHHVHILEMNGESYRLKSSKSRKRRAPLPDVIDPDTGEILGEPLNE